MKLDPGDVLFVVLFGTLAAGSSVLALVAAVAVWIGRLT